MNLLFPLYGMYVVVVHYLIKKQVHVICRVKIPTKIREKLPFWVTGLFHTFSNLQQKKKI